MCNRHKSGRSETNVCQAQADEISDPEVPKGSDVEQVHAAGSAHCPGALLIN